MSDIFPGWDDVQKDSYAATAAAEWKDADYIRRDLNGQFEDRLSTLLRDDPTIGAQVRDWARAMCGAIPGYGDRGEVLAFVSRCLGRGDGGAGAENDLVETMSESQAAMYAMSDAPNLALVRVRLDVIAGFADGSRDDPKAQALAGQVYGAYKLLEALWGQVGYWPGSFEFDTGLTDSLEYWFYLLDLKLRDPARQLPLTSPKQIAVG
jgi:hypothetical protein